MGGIFTIRDLYSIYIKKEMKSLRLLIKVFRETQTHKIILIFLAFFFACAFVIWFREPEINSFPDALWYCYTVVTTVGFGDLVVHTHLARILSVILSVYAVVIIAITTGVVVNFFMQMAEIRKKNTLAEFVDKLEHLPELSKEELEDLSDRVKRFHEGMKK